MSRLLSWLVPALLIAGGWFAWQKGVPMFRHWKAKQTAQQACKDVAERVRRGLHKDNAQGAVEEELMARMRERNDIVLDEFSLQVEIWQEECKVQMDLPDGARIRTTALFLAE